MARMRIAITGGTGLVGRSLARAAQQRGDSVAVVSRTAGDNRIVWDLDEGLQPPDAWSGLDAVVHLAGAGVADERWTKARKREIMDSRRRGTQRVVEGLARADPRPPLLISASAVGFYGDGGDTVLTEASAAGSDFLADVCTHWERQADAAAELDVRVVKLRFGLVLSTEGGALAKMLPAFRLGAGGRMGRGTQYMPWIHIDDAIGALLAVLDDPEASGAYNVTAPNPVDNRTFTAALGRTLSRPALIPVPAFALRAMFGELSSALLAGQRAVPSRLQASGYAFRFESLDAALTDLLKP